MWGVRVCFPVLSFSSLREKKNLNTKECVKSTNVKAPGPLDDYQGVKGQNVFSAIVSVQALTRWNKFSKLPGDW